MLQHKVAQTAIRPNFNPIISSGKLFQQWVVDSYVQVEANNLNFIRNNQTQLRSENYQGLMDHLANVAADEGVLAGRTTILPSSFQGSPRNMRERYQDAMAIVSKFGPPDLFVTFTCNPAWPEIVDNLQPGEQSSDRPDLVARVFKLKLAEMMKDLTVVGVLGVAVAYVYTRVVC
jgi:Helitron helicase-like domain at N-terminus